MAVTQLSQTPIGSTDFTLLKNEVTKNAKSINPISLSNYDTDAAPVVKVGSVFENNGATFIVDTGDETPTGYAGISVSTTFYLYYDESATAFIFDSTVPVWSDALQGYYNGNDRAFFSMYKDSGGTLYENKYLLTHLSDQQIGDLQLEGKLKFKKYYYATSVTGGTIYDELVSWVPSTGDVRSCTGMFTFNSNGRRNEIYNIWRNTSTTILLNNIISDVQPNQFQQTQLDTSSASLYDVIELWSNNEVQ